VIDDHRAAKHADTSTRPRTSGYRRAQQRRLRAPLYRATNAIRVKGTHSGAARSSPRSAYRHLQGNQLNKSRCHQCTAWLPLPATPRSTNLLQHHSERIERNIYVNRNQIAPSSAAALARRSSARAKRVGRTTCPLQRRPTFQGGREAWTAHKRLPVCVTSEPSSKPSPSRATANPNRLNTGPPGAAVIGPGKKTPARQARAARPLRQSRSHFRQASMRRA